MKNKLEQNADTVNRINRRLVVLAVSFVICIVLGFGAASAAPSPSDYELNVIFGSGVDTAYPGQTVPVSVQLSVPSGLNGFNSIAFALNISNLTSISIPNDPDTGEPASALLKRGSSGSSIVGSELRWMGYSGHSKGIGPVTGTPSPWLLYDFTIEIPSSADPCDVVLTLMTMAEYPDSEMVTSDDDGEEDVWSSFHMSSPAVLHIVERPPSHWVTFDTDHKAEVAPQQIENGTNASRPINPAADGYIFDNWYTTSTFDTPFDFENTLITNDTLVYGKWNLNGAGTNVTYAVTFNLSGHGNNFDQNVREGYRVTKPSDPTAEGYIFNGWNLADGSAYDFNSSVTESFTIYAVWIIDPSVTDTKTWTVDFDTAGHGTVAPRIVLNNTALESLPVLHEDGYNFNHWYIKSSDPSAAYNASLPVTGDLHLVANWTALSSAATREVIFVLDSGAAEEFSRATVFVGKCVAAPSPCPSKEGHSFDGWYTDNSLSTLYDFSTPVSESPSPLVLYAKLTPKQYTVSFDVCGHGVVPSSQTVDYNTTISEPAAPTADNYTFNGWHKSGEAVPYVFTTPVTESFILYADWKKDPAAPAAECLVSFNMMGHGKADVPAQFVVSGGNAVEPTAPVDDNYDFIGWYTTSALSTAYDFAGTAVTRNITIYAKWALKSGITPTGVNYTVSFNMMGHGSSISSKTVPSGASFSAPAVPVSDGWIFNGWYVEETLETEYTFPITVNQDHVLYANWVRYGDVAHLTTLFSVTFRMNPENLTGITLTDVLRKVADGELVSMEHPTSPGYTFCGWYETSDYSGPVYTGTAPVTYSFDLYAKWLPDQKLSLVSYNGWVKGMNPAKTGVGDYLKDSVTGLNITDSNTEEEYVAKSANHDMGFNTSNAGKVVYKLTGHPTDDYGLYSPKLYSINGEYLNLTRGTIQAYDASGSPLGAASAFNCSLLSKDADGRYVFNSTYFTQPAADHYEITFNGRKLGDVDGNGDVKGLDASEISRKVLGKVLSEEQLFYADFNQDFSVKGTDASEISRKVLGTCKLYWL